MEPPKTWCLCRKLWFDPEGPRVCPCLQPVTHAKGTLVQLCPHCEKPLDSPQVHVCPSTQTP